MIRDHDVDEDRVYRDIIDRMVKACREGQGQISAHRTRAGVWNRNEEIPDQHEINQLLARMPQGDREILARMLTEEFVGGVFSALATLNEAGLPPFDKAYEGTPFHDFVGRLADWEWPSAAQRS